MLFFDLDGTLIDSAVGISRCVAHALRELGEPVPADTALRGWIGPPLRDSFGPLLGDAVRTERAVELYRERFEDVGWREHAVYPGIADALSALAADGRRLLVVTAKNEPHARRIVAHLPFAHVFEDVVGATADGTLSHKHELIAEALRRTGTPASAATMIGDRHFDIDGARRHRMPSVGVLWGFGDADELRHADRLAATPADLPSLLC